MDNTPRSRRLQEIIATIFEEAVKKVNNPIVFIHGSGDSARIWRLQTEQTEQLVGHRVFAVDLPGHGERADTLPDEVTILNYANIVHDIITNELKLDHPIIAGHSLGGAIALTMALEYGAELGGLILIGTGSRLRVHPDILASAKAATPEAQLQVAQLSVTDANKDTLPQALISEQKGTKNTMLYRDLMACNSFDCMARMDEVTLPTLIICGTEDRMTPVKYSQYLHERIPGSTLRLIPAAGHYVMREQPEQVNQAIEEWLEHH